MFTTFKEMEAYVLGQNMKSVSPWPTPMTSPP